MFNNAYIKLLKMPFF